MEVDKSEQKEVSPIKQAIFYAMKLVGFNTQNINKESLGIIINNIKENHKDISIENLREAFELGANGKLDVNLNTYQSFNTLYASNVLGGYRRYKRNKIQLDKFKLPAPKGKFSWSMQEKKGHFEWLRDEVFLDDSKRNGSKGTFPDVLIASFKDIYDYMLSERMLNELMGKQLEERIEEAIRIEKSETKNPKKSIGTTINNSRNDGNAPACFYKLEVKSWFKQKKQQLFTN